MQVTSTLVSGQKTVLTQGRARLARAAAFGPKHQGPVFCRDLPGVGEASRLQSERARNLEISPGWAQISCCLVPWSKKLRSSCPGAVELNHPALGVPSVVQKVKGWTLSL